MGQSDNEDCWLTIIYFKVGSSSILLITESSYNTYIVLCVVRYIQLNTRPLSKVNMDLRYNINAISGGSVTGGGPF